MIDNVSENYIELLYRIANYYPKIGKYILHYCPDKLTL